MKQIHTNNIADDALIQAVRACAADSDIRILQDLELGWVGGGDPQPLPDYSVPPTP